jgi:hypothetical protein
MSRVLKIKSDDDGAELTDHLHVTIERPGYLIVLPDGSKTNMAVLDVEPGHQGRIFRKLTYEKIPSMALMAGR